MTGRFVLSYRGSVNVIAKPAAAELAAYTTSVAQNNRLTLRTDSGGPVLAPRRKVAARGPPRRPRGPAVGPPALYIAPGNPRSCPAVPGIANGRADTPLASHRRGRPP